MKYKQSNLRHIKAIFCEKNGIEFNSDEKGNGNMTAGKKGFRRGLTALIAAAAILLLSTGTYAVVRMVQTDRADTGADFVYVAAPASEDFDPSLYGIYHIYIIDSASSWWRAVDDESAQELRVLLDGMIFNENGEPIDVIVPVPKPDPENPNRFKYSVYTVDRGEIDRSILKAGTCRVDTQYPALYDADGKEIAWIDFYYSVNVFGKPARIFIQTVEGHERFTESNSVVTYEEAAEFLGRDFRLPTVYVDNLTEATCVTCCIPYSDYNTDDIKDGISEYVQVGLGPDDNADTDVQKNTPPIVYTVRNTRDDGDVFVDIVIEGAVIEEFTLLETTVYRVASPGYISYVWEHDGLSYMLWRYIQPSGSDYAEFTDEQCEEIILSMIE